MLAAYARALAITLLVEVPLCSAALVALRLSRPAPAVVLAIAVNLATHPILWWSLALSQAPIGIQLISEVLVSVTEGGLLWWRVRRDAPLLMLLSLGTNAASFLTGVVF